VAAGKVQHLHFHWRHLRLYRQKAVPVHDPRRTAVAGSLVAVVAMLHRVLDLRFHGFDLKLPI